MDEIIQIGRWVLRADVARTRAAHAQLRLSGAAECRCSACLNFVAARPQLLAGPLGAVLERLGIAPPWEVEAYDLGHVSAGIHCYGAWFHFVGRIESGPDAWVATSDANTRLADFEALTPNLSIGFHYDLPWARRPFADMPLVQLEIVAELPWVIDAPQPK